MKNIIFIIVLCFFGACAKPSKQDSNKSNFEENVSQNCSSISTENILITSLDTIVLTPVTQINTFEIKCTL